MPDNGSNWRPETFDFVEYARVRGRCYLFWNLTPNTGVPALVAFISGQCAREWESLSDEEITKQVLDCLANMFPMQTPLPNVLESIVTRWSCDENVRGSYSFVAKGSSGQDYELLAKPLDRLFFAGEATVCQETFRANFISRIDNIPLQFTERCFQDIEPHDKCLKRYNQACHPDQVLACNS